MRIRLLASLPLVALTVALSGCGGGGGSIDGKVVNGSAAYNPAESGDITVNVAGDDGTTNGGGKVASDGTFKVTNYNGSGFPAGKYRVSLTIYPKGAGGEPKPGEKAPPAPANKNLDEKWDVSASNHTFTIDLAKLKK